MKATLIYWKDGEWVVGRLKERPDVFSQGKTLEELEENIRDAYRLMCETDLADLPADCHQKEIQLEAV